MPGGPHSEQPRHPSGGQGGTGQITRRASTLRMYPAKQANLAMGLRVWRISTCVVSP